LKLTEERGFRREFFLLDTGSPKSILIREIASDVVKIGSSLSKTSIIEVEGVSVAFELQDFDGGDTRTRNINLLGTDFINAVVLIDDFFSKTIRVLKRANSFNVTY